MPDLDPRLERRLVSVGKAHARATAEAAKTQRARDRAILDALEAGAGIRPVARAAGMDAKSVHRLNQSRLATLALADPLAADEAEQAAEVAS